MGTGREVRNTLVYEYIKAFFEISARDINADHERQLFNLHMICSRGITTGGTTPKSFAAFGEKCSTEISQMDSILTVPVASSPMIFALSLLFH